MKTLCCKRGSSSCSTHISANLISGIFTISNWARVGIASFLFLPLTASAGLFSAQHLVSTTAANAVFVADLDQDGKPDVVSASTSAGNLVWRHGNGDGTFGAAQTIATGLTGATAVFVADINGDGRPDIVAAGGNRIAWYANLGGGAFGSAQVVTASANGVSAVFAADMDRDGKIDLVTASAGDGTIRWYRNSGGGTFGSGSIISSSAAGASAIYVADLDQDGAPDVVCATASGLVVWWHNNNDGTFGSGQTISTTATSAVSIFAADLNRDGHPDVVVAGGAKIAWYPNLISTSGAFGSEHVVSNVLSGATSVVAADFNGDDFPDLVCATAGDNTISWFQNAGSGTFGARQIIASDMTGATTVFAADVDRDGDVDVVAASSGKITWYSNQSIHQSAVYPTRNVISNTANYAYAVFSADIDGDGLADVISVSELDNKVAWYHNNGNGTFGSEQVISNQAVGAWRVFAADLKGHGRKDVIVACSNPSQIIWFENLGGGSFGPMQLVTSAVDWPWSVVAADMDGDGKIDVISASANDNKIAWYKNLGGGNFGSQQIISSAANSPSSIYVADIDGDGKPDIVSASFNDQKIAWYKNLGGSFGPQQVITSLPGPYAVLAADLDKDGRIDVVAASHQGGQIIWCHNNGNGTFGPAQTIAQSLGGSLGGVYSLLGADLDRDGSIDILAAASNFSLTTNQIAWFRNLGNSTFSGAQIISTNLIGPTSVYAGNINGNGSVGVLSASNVDNTVASYPSSGGGFALATSSTAPSSMREGQKRDVFKIVLTHRGLAGDDDVLLNSLTLLFEQTPGAPLSTAQAANLIRSVSIYGDTVNSGVFDATRDSTLFKQTSLALSNGKLVLNFSGANPGDFKTSAGAPRTFFVAVELTQNASSQSPNSFLVTNVTDQTGAVTGSDAQAGSAVAAEYAQSVSTSQIAIAADQAPVGTGLANVALQDTSKGSVISLFPAFSDTEDTSQGLTYTITGDTNPGIFDFAGIDSANGLLVLNYHAGVKGTSQITITANDSSGKTASVTFSVNANLITTIADWRAGRYGSSAITGSGDLLNYAFALPRSGANGPSMRKQYGSLVFSHLKPKYAADLFYSYQITQDLVHWIPAVSGVHYFPYAVDLGDGTFSENFVLLVKWNSAFMRATAQLTAAGAATPNTGGTGSSAASTLSLFNNAPTTTGIADVTILDTAATTTISLFNAFSDVEDAPQQMSYAVTGNTNPNLFASASIDAGNGLLNLKYKTTGSAVLTITARDTGGKTVTTSFNVSVAAIHTFAEWNSFYFGSAPSTTSQQLMDYGLVIDPRMGGNFGVLPALKQVNGSLVFSHLRPKFATDATYQYQISSDLVHWMPAVNGVHYFDFSQDLNDGTRMVNLLLLVDWPKAFIRVGINLTP